MVEVAADVHPNGSPNGITSSDYVILTGTSNPRLVETVSSNLHLDSYAVARQHGDGETYVKIPSSVRDRHVFIIQSGGPKFQDRYLMEIEQMAWASKACGAEKVTAIIPYFPYARSDRMNRGRSSKTVELVSNKLWASGIDKLVTVDLHAEQSATGNGGPSKWDNFYGSYVLVPALEELVGSEKDRVRVIAPDSGAVGRATFFNDMMGIPEDISTVVKRRNPENRDDVRVNLYGDFQYTVPVIVDDMIDTAGTVRKIAELLRERGGEPAYIAATHGVLSGPALDNLDTSSIRDGGVLITDTLAPSDEILNHPKIRVCSIAPLISEVIRRTIGRRGRMSELFSGVSKEVSFIRDSFLDIGDKSLGQLTRN